MNSKEYRKKHYRKLRSKLYCRIKKMTQDEWKLLIIQKSPVESNEVIYSKAFFTKHDPEGFFRNIFFEKRFFQKEKRKINASTLYLTI